MDRRGVLKGFGVAATAALWPGWLREAFAGEPCCVLRGSATLAAAMKRANDRLKPLLILIIPTDLGGMRSRGEHFGEWLNGGSDRDLAPLATAEVVCAELATVRQLFPSAPDTDPEPAVLLANVDRSPAQISVALASFPAHAGARDEDASVQQCIDWTGAAIRKALTGDQAALKLRAAALWDRLDVSQRQIDQRILDGGDAPPATVLELGPHLAAAALQQGGAVERRLTSVLAAAVRVAYCQHRVPGSKWAVSDGCGETVEGEEDLQSMVDCGMGVVPAKSRRFLHFFTRP